MASPHIAKSAILGRLFTFMDSLILMAFARISKIKAEFRT
jgi:hypothetical protein